MAAMRPPLTVPGPVATALAATALVLLPGTAAADVTVAASHAASGARDVTITFRVTDDDPAVAVTRLEVFLPTVRPLLGVVPTAPTGWTARVGTAPPAAPLTVDGEPVAEIATTVTWDGGAVPADGYAVFPIDVDRLPDGAGPLRFRVIQTSADGTTVEWSDLLPYGAPAPQHPALVVPYADAPPALPEVSGHHHGAGTEVLAVGGRSGSGWWTVALAGSAGALVAAGSVVLGRRQRRRFAALIDRDRRS
jgi:periplasmic copper chaperone A